MPLLDRYTYIPWEIGIVPKTVNSSVDGFSSLEAYIATSGTPVTKVCDIFNYRFLFPSSGEHSRTKAITSIL